MFMYSHKVTVELLIGGKMGRWAHVVHLPRKGVGDAHSRLIALSRLPSLSVSVSQQMKSDPWQAELHETQRVTVREVPNSGKVTPRNAPECWKAETFQSDRKISFDKCGHTSTKILHPENENKGHC